MLRDISHSRVSGCLIRDERPGNGAAVPLRLDGAGNLISRNLVRGRLDVDARAAKLEGNVEQE